MDVTMPRQTLRILLVEDHPIVRHGVAPILQSLSDNVQLSVAENLKSAMATLEDNPDLNLVLVDLMLPDGSGLSLLKSSKDASSGLPVVIFTGADDIEMIEDALANGSKGFITKDTNPDLIVHALRLVLAGGVYVPEKLVGCFRSTRENATVGLSPKQKVRSLTQRQMEVLKLLVAAKSNREIAMDLDCAESTVKTHVTAVLKTLGFATRAKAIKAVDEWPWLRDINGLD